MRNLAHCANRLASNAKPVRAETHRLSPTLANRYLFMEHLNPELEKAWEELAFWRDFAVWWNAQHRSSPEPRILEALELAERRYTEATQLRL